MMTLYELWDVDGGNMLGVYPDEATALAEIRAGVREDGAEAWATVGLLRVDEQPGNAQRIAEGEALIALAQGTSTTTAPTPARRVS
jgi:hypothetical protein